MTGEPLRSLAGLPRPAKRKDLGVIHRRVPSLLSHESWACNDFVCVPRVTRASQTGVLGILSSGSAVVVVEHVTQPLQASRFTYGAEAPRLWVGEPGSCQGAHRFSVLGPYVVLAHLVGERTAEVLEADEKSFYTGQWSG